MKKSLKVNKCLWIISALLAIVVACFLIIPRDGHDFEADGIYYKIECDSLNIVSVTYKGDSYKAYADEYVGAVVIPENITYKGINYIVEYIDDGAFKDCSKMTSITIPPSVRMFGHGAFSGCDGLKEIHIRDLSAWCELLLCDVFDAIGEGLSPDIAKNLHCHFSKIEWTGAGEKRHLTFEDTVYGPAFEPLAEALAKDGLTPTIICESAGTQSEDAYLLKKCYEGYLK